MDKIGWMEDIVPDDDEVGSKAVLCTSPKLEFVYSHYQKMNIHPICTTWGNIPISDHY